MTWLLDGNLLVALAIDTHEFHDRARRWFDGQEDPFATCAVTEGTLLRVHMRLAADRTTIAAWRVLEAIHAMDSHEYWEAGFSYREVATAGIIGSGDVTDAWLAELVRRREGRLAMMDVALAARHSDAAVLIPT